MHESVCEMGLNLPLFCQFLGALRMQKLISPRAPESSEGCGLLYLTGVLEPTRICILISAAHSRFGARTLLKKKGQERERLAGFFQEVTLIGGDLQTEVALERCL